MKIQIDLDLTPEEARRMLGLPDLEPMQQRVLEQIEQKIGEGIEAMSEPDYLLKTFMPAGLQGMEQMQNFFTEFARQATRQNKKKD